MNGVKLRNIKQVPSGGAVSAAPAAGGAAAGGAAAPAAEEEKKEEEKVRPLDWLFILRLLLSSSLIVSQCIVWFI